MYFYRIFGFAPSTPFFIIVIANYNGSNMEIIVRQKKEKKIKVEDGLSIGDLLKDLGINRETVLVAKNGEISLEEDVLKEGDVVDIISVISGG